MAKATLAGTALAASLTSATAFSQPGAPPQLRAGAAPAAEAIAQQANVAVAGKNEHGGVGAGTCLGIASMAAGLLSLRGAARKVGSRRVRVARSAMFQRQAPRTPPRPVAIPALPEPGYRKFEDPILGEADAGFDPLNLATSEAIFWGKDAETQYYNYREAEMKHGRLAMLAALGWLSSEQLQSGLAQSLGLPDDLVGNELAPSLVNGGLGDIPVWFLPAVVLVTAWIESIPKQRGLRADALTYKPGRGRVPGDFGFDPLGFQSVAEGFGRDLKWLHNAELKNGRLAMIAISAFVAQEFVSRGSVIAETQLVAESLSVAAQEALL